MTPSQRRLPGRADARRVDHHDLPVSSIDGTGRQRYGRALCLPVYQGSAVADLTIEELDFSGMRRMLAMTPNDELNSLGCLQFATVLGRRDVYQLRYTDVRETASGGGVAQTCGRFLFDDKTSFPKLVERFGDHVAVKTTRLSQEFDYQAYRDQHGDKVLPVFLVRKRQEVVVFTADERPTPQPGDTIIALCQKGHTIV